MLDLENMTVGKLRERIRKGAPGDVHSKRFGEEVYENLEFRLGEYDSHADHLRSVLASMDGDRLVSDVISREENLAQVLEILEAVEVEPELIEQAYTKGKEAWNDAVGNGYAVSAACSKAAAPCGSQRCTANPAPPTEDFRRARWKSKIRR